MINIDISELREAIQTFGSQAINEGDLNEIFDRLEAVEKGRDAVLDCLNAWKELAKRWEKERDVLRIENAELLAKLEAAERNLGCCRAEREEAASLFLSVKAKLIGERDALRAELAQLHKEADKFGDGVDWIQQVDGLITPTTI